MNDYNGQFPIANELDSFALPEFTIPQKLHRRLPFFAKLACFCLAFLVLLSGGFTCLIALTPQASSEPEGGYYVFVQNTVPKNDGKPEKVSDFHQKMLQEDTDFLLTTEAEEEAIAADVRANNMAESTLANFNETQTPSTATMSAPTTLITTTFPATTTTLPAATTTLPKPTTTLPKPTTTLPKPTTTTTTVTEKNTAPKSEQTTEKPAAKATTTAAPKNVKSIVFTVYGFGHGVGMSQVGAISMAKSGKKYDEILLHYYPGCTLEADTKAPKTVNFSGTNYALVSFLARAAEKEIGRSAPEEAFKAQVVAIYTFVKNRKFKNLSSAVLAISSNKPSEGSLARVRSALGMKNSSASPRPQMIMHKGKIIFAPFFASSAGKTTDVTSVWGGSAAAYPYLEGGISSPEKTTVAQTTFSVADFRKYVAAYNKKYPARAIVLGDDPGQWITIISHDGSVSKDIGYIKKIKVGNQTMSGYAFRHYLLGLTLRSHCFTVEYM